MSIRWFGKMQQVLSTLAVYSMIRSTEVDCIFVDHRAALYNKVDIVEFLVQRVCITALANVVTYYCVMLILSCKSRVCYTRNWLIYLFIYEYQFQLGRQRHYGSLR